MQIDSITVAGAVPELSQIVTHRLPSSHLLAQVITQKVRAR
jgi:hypothetical protein